MSVLWQSTAYSNSEDIFEVEYFFGAGAVRRMTAMVSGLATLGFDIAKGPLQDFNGHSGYITVLPWFRRLMPDGWAWFWTVCSTWVFMCRASTGRNTSTPRGNTRQACVREGNMHVARTCLLNGAGLRHSSWLLPRAAGVFDDAADGGYALDPKNALNTLVLLFTSSRLTWGPLHRSTSSRLICAATAMPSMI